MRLSSHPSTALVAAITVYIDFLLTAIFDIFITGVITLTLVEERDPEAYRLGYCLSHEQPYWDAEFELNQTRTIYDIGVEKKPLNLQGVMWEFRITWRGDSFDSIPAVQIRIYDEAWEAFTLCPELFERLAKIDDPEITVEDVVTILDELGFENFTSLYAPNA